MTAATVTSVSVAGDQSLSVAPTGNPAATFSSLSCQAVATQAKAREFLANIGFTSALGGGNPPGVADKVALYAGVVGSSGTADIWSINTETVLSAGSGSYNATGFELDLNNLNAERGSADGGAGLAAPVAVGLAVTGAGSFLSTAAISIEGPGSTAIWNRGIVIGDSSVAQATLQDLGSASISLDIRGSHAVSVDTWQSSGIPLRIPNNKPIVAQSAAGTGNIPIVAVDIDNNIEIGSSSSSFIVAGAHTIPASDNAYDLGFPSNRWANIYAVNGVVQTSDPALKSDIGKLPAVEQLIKTIDPVTFRWKQDDAQIAEVTEDVAVHDTEWREVEEEIVVIRDGKAVRVRQKRKAEIYLYDELPVEDEEGNPVMVTVQEQRDASGTVIQPASTRQATHRAPRMVARQVAVKRPVAAPGKRLHWGFLAPEVKAGFDAIGLDFGGHVVGEDGVQHLRPDQLIPVLWKAVQELLERIEILEAKLS
ncbi:MAG: hypothetical protein WDN69_11930 [Aliidongia sp.]